VLAANPEACAEEADLLALTCSNLGCYYRKAGLPRAALRYLDRALKMEEAASREAPQDARSVATTKLNACAALSGVGNHEEAERLAMEATRLLVSQEAVGPPDRKECALLAVACHNLGAEREHLGRWAAAAVAFRQGAEVASRALGPNSELARALTQSCSEALVRAERHPSTPDRPAASRSLGGTPRRPWPRGLGSAGRMIGRPSPRRGRSSHGLQVPGDCQSWGRPGSAGLEAMASVTDAGPEVEPMPSFESPTSQQMPRSLGVGDFEEAMEEELEEAPGKELPAMLPRGLAEREAAEDWGDAAAPGWRGNSRVRLLAAGERQSTLGEARRHLAGHLPATAGASGAFSMPPSPRHSLVMDGSPAPGMLPMTTVRSSGGRRETHAAPSGLHPGFTRSS